MQWVRADKALSPGIGVLIDTTRLLNSESSASPYYILVKGTRYYGQTPELTIAPKGEQEWAPDSGQTGVGINIDMGRLLNRKDNPYYITINGQRCYGSNPATVLTNARLQENYVNDSQLSGGAVLIDTQKLLQSAAEPYFMSVSGQCIYGSSAESVMSAIGNGNQGVRCPKSGVTAIMLDEDYLSSSNTILNQNSYYILINGWRVYGNSPESVLENVKKNMAQIKNPANPSLFSRISAATRKAGSATAGFAGAAAAAFTRKSMAKGQSQQPQGMTSVGPNSYVKEKYLPATRGPQAEPTFTAYQSELATKSRPRQLIPGVQDYPPTNIENFAKKFPTNVNTEGNRFFNTPYGHHRQNSRKQPMFNSRTGFPLLVNKSGRVAEYGYRTTPNDYRAALQQGGSGRRTYKRHKAA
jgi:hypothetical protein